jgi:hypothetical protein
MVLLTIGYEKGVRGLTKQNRPATKYRRVNIEQGLRLVGPTPRRE